MSAQKFTLPFIVLLIICCSCFSQPAEKKYAAYLFTYFIGNEKSEEAIRFALSTDGYTWRALNGNQPVIDSRRISSTGGVRDPHILRAADGKSFYMVATDMVSANGWNSNRAMVLLKSNDLINWTSSVVHIQKRFSGQENLHRVWAPQTIYDSKAGKYMIYWSMQHGEGPDIIYWAYANKDFTDLETTPEPLFKHPEGHACIDGDIIYHNGKYHLFFKTEGKNLGIRVAVSDDMKRGYTLQPGSVQQTTDPVEGSGVFKLNDGSGYILMYDLYTKGKYQFTKSTDLKSFRLVDHAVSMNFHPRHGTVIPVTAQEASALIKRWYTAGDVIASAQSPDIRTNNILLDTASASAYFPVKQNAALKALDPKFMLFPGIKISPKPPYDLTRGPLRVEVGISGQTARHFYISGSVDQNPVLNGYYADPEVLYSNKTGKFYLYPTSDGFNGWSGNYFKAFSSQDLSSWKDEGIILDLPKDVRWADRNAWAPTIAEKKVAGSYRYFYYFSAAQKIGVAVSEEPAGPFRDSGKPLIQGHPKGLDFGQEIDPDVFTDPVSGKSYLYWGNGYMAAAPLNDDMISIDTSRISIITPDDTYREGTEIFFRNGKYYFMWSENDTRDADYAVRYGIADSPTGKIIIPGKNRILSRKDSEGIYGTGHNSILKIPGKDEWYIVYHRFTRPKGILMGEAAGFNREVCIDRLYFNEDGSIKPVVPTTKGVRISDK